VCAVFIKCALVGGNSYSFLEFHTNNKMGLDFDVLEICRKLRNSKQPPYECPVPECGKIYKSLCGLQDHLVNFDHNSPPPVNSTPTPGKNSHLIVVSHQFDRWHC
jgi:hypothetical protein